MTSFSQVSQRQILLNSAEAVAFADFVRLSRLKTLAFNSSMLMNPSQLLHSASSWISKLLPSLYRLLAFQFISFFNEFSSSFETHVLFDCLLFVEDRRDVQNFVRQFFSHFKFAIASLASLSVATVNNNLLHLARFLSNFPSFVAAVFWISIQLFLVLSELR